MCTDWLSGISVHISVYQIYIKYLADEVSFKINGTFYTSAIIFPPNMQLVYDELRVLQHTWYSKSSTKDIEFHSFLCDVTNNVTAVIISKLHLYYQYKCPKTVGCM